MSRLAIVDPLVPEHKRAEQDAYNRERAAVVRAKVLASNIAHAELQPDAGPVTVYTARDHLGRVLYVGQTAHLEQRLAAHRARSAWWSQMLTVQSEELPDRIAALRCEHETIERLRPPWNELYEDDRYGQGYRN